MTLRDQERQFVEHQRRYYQNRAEQSDPAASLAAKVSAVLIVLVTASVIGLWVGQHLDLPDEPLALLGAAIGLGILWRTRGVIAGRSHR